MSIEATNSDFKREVIIRTLPNGLKVYLKEDHFAPVVAAYLWVKSGSADELDSEAGLAHVHEHMIFKGTSKRAVGQIAKEIESAGGDINAFTSFDHTVYHITIASRYYPVAIDVLADAVSHASFDEKELKKELAVILEELKRARDNPNYRLQDELFKLAYTAHPFGKPIIGYEQTIQSFSRDDVLQFFNKHYTADNMFLVVVGDFDKDELWARIKEHFSQIPENKSQKPQRTSEPEQEKLRVKLEQMPISKAYLGIGFHIVSALHEDAPALDLLSVILSTGESSRLYNRIKIQKELMHDVWSYSYTPKDPGIFAVGGTLSPKNLEDAVRAAAKELFELTVEEVDQQELEKAKNQLLSEFVFDSETVQGRARKMGYYIDTLNDPYFEQKYIANIDKLTPADLLRVAKNYFQPNKASIAVLLPDSVEPPKIEKIQKAISDGFDAAQSPNGEQTINSDKPTNPKVPATDGGSKSYEIVEEKSGITKARLANGMTVLFKPNHSVPTFSIRVVAKGGLRSETEETQGISNFISDMLTRGTETRSYWEIASEVDFLGGSLNGFSGRNTTGISADFMSRHFERAIELVADVAKNPSFPPAEIERKRREIIFAIERRKDSPARSAIDLFAKTLYKRHPYRFITLGSKDTVSTFTREELIEHYRRLFTPQNIVISIVGDLDKTSALDAVARLLADWKGSDVELKTPEPEQKPEGIRIAQERREKEQCHILVGFLGSTLTSKDRYAMDVLNAVLASQGGRLFVNLRDREHLAYAVSSINMIGVEPGFWAIYMGTSPNNVEQALRGIKREIAALIKNNITTDELERAKRYLIGTHEIELQTNEAQAMQIALGEMLLSGYDEPLRFSEFIDKVTLEDVAASIDKHASIDCPVIVSVGPCEIDDTMWQNPD